MGGEVLSPEGLCCRCDGKAANGAQSNGKSSEEGLVTTWLFWVLVLQKRQIVLVSFSPKSKPSAAGFAMRKPKLLHWKQLPKITAGVTKHTLAWFYLPPTYQYRILKPT